MANPKLSYSFKLAAQLPALEQFRRVVTPLYEELVNLLWTDQTLDKLAATRKKTYKVIGEAVVNETPTGKRLYVPSRVRRGITEHIGRVLRSQAERRQCWRAVLSAVQVTGVTGNLDCLVKQVFRTIVVFRGEYYHYAIIRQQLRTLRRYYYCTGVDLQFLQSLLYTQFVKPRLSAFVFPYAADDGLDGQSVKLEDRGTAFAVALKLPTTATPQKRADWQWFDFTLPVPAKLAKRLQAFKRHVHLPRLEYRTLKGSLERPFLQIPFTVQKKTLPALVQERVLSVDLGIIHLACSVVNQAGTQVSPPAFFTLPHSYSRKIEKLYTQLSRLQRRLRRRHPHAPGQRRRARESQRLLRKGNSLRREIVHLLTKHLVQRAIRWQASTIVLEDLRSYHPPRGQGVSSRKLSEWLRGAVYEVLTYKAALDGIAVRRVNPRYTSSYCPRCGKKGRKISDPRRRRRTVRGRFFHCPHCHFVADRDYVGALNVYRRYCAQQKQNYSLKTAPLLPYMARSSHSTASGGTLHPTRPMK